MSVPGVWSYWQWANFEGMVQQNIKWLLYYEIDNPWQIPMYFTVSWTEERLVIDQVEIDGVLVEISSYVFLSHTLTKTILTIVLFFFIWKWWNHIFRRIQCGWPQWAALQTRALKMPRPWNSFGSQTWRSTGCRWWSLEQSNFDGNHVWGVQEAPHLGWNGWIEDLSVTLRASSDDPLKTRTTNHQK